MAPGESLNPAAPVSLAERVASIDVLRGIALLGILTMNIGIFAYVGADFFNPTIEGQYEGANRTVWLVNHFLFDMKMMSIFSMLFGAGIILMTGRAQERGRSPGGFHYRRMAWLLLFGLIHAYFIWHGDILFIYAVCGMLVYPLRKLPPKWLAVIGIVVMLIALPINTGVGLGMGYMRDGAIEAQAAIDAGQTLTSEQKGLLDGWNNARKGLEPTEEDLIEETGGYLGSYAAVFRTRAPQSIFMQTFLLLTWGVWRVSGLMLIGMALMKTGAFNAAWAARRYATMAAIGYSIGFLLVFAGWRRMESSNFDIIQTYAFNWHFNYVGSVLVALGHISLVMLWLRSGALGMAQRALANVGRTAFSNYILQSLICTTLFYGYGVGLFGSLERWQLALVVLGVWAVNLAFSTLWLSRFRYGPLEWLWRSLTYARLQPMRLTPALSRPG